MSRHSRAGGNDRSKYKFVGIEYYEDLEQGFEIR
jgi:hypothetical protein